MIFVSSENCECHITKGVSGRGGRVHRYLGVVGKMHDGPQAYIVEMLDPQSVIEPHFHDVDQFQIFVEGSGTFGKKKVQAVTAQYADAYTPYGPIVADETLSYFTLRLAASGAFFPMPGSRDKMPGPPGRNAMARFDVAAGDDRARTTALSPPTDDGMRLDGLYIPPQAKAQGITNDGGGQYYLVCAGALIHDGATMPRLSLAYVAAGEPPPTFTAGPEGAAVLMAQFPRPTQRPGSDPAALARREAAHSAPFKDHAD